MAAAQHHGATQLAGAAQVGLTLDTRGYTSIQVTRHEPLLQGRVGPPDAATPVVLKRVTGSLQSFGEGRVLGYLARGPARTCASLLTPTAFVLQRDGGGACTDAWAELPMLSDCLSHMVPSEAFSAAAAVNGVRRALCHDLASGVCALHAAGVVHTDIKPENTALCPRTGRLVLFDYDIAIDAATALVLEPASAPMCTITTRPPEWDNDKHRYTAAGGYRPAYITAGDVYSAAMCMADVLFGSAVDAGDIRGCTTLRDIRTSRGAAAYGYVMRRHALRMAQDAQLAAATCPGVPQRAWHALARAMRVNPAERCCARELRDAFVWGAPEAGGNDGSGADDAVRSAVRALARKRPARLETAWPRGNTGLPAAHYTRYALTTAAAPLALDAPRPPTRWLVDEQVQCVCTWARDAAARVRHAAVRIESVQATMYQARCVVHAAAACNALRDAASKPRDVKYTCGISDGYRYEGTRGLLTHAVLGAALDSFVGDSDNVVSLVVQACGAQCRSDVQEQRALLRVLDCLSTSAGLWRCLETPADAATALCDAGE